MAWCNRKTCAYNECGRCNLFRKDGLRPNTQMCRWYKFDAFAAFGNHPIFWLVAMFFIITISVLLTR